jgi:hypothetical protein
MTKFLLHELYEVEWNYEDEFLIWKDMRSNIQILFDEYHKYSVTSEFHAPRITLLPIELALVYVRRRRTYDFS